MIFSEPLPFSQALETLRAKHLLPTNLSSAELRELDAGLRGRAMFSARTTKAQILQGCKDELKELMDGKTNIATARAKMQDLFDRLHYTPDRGFPGDEGLDIPPADKGELRDLSGNRRIDLVLDTNLSQMANRGFRAQGQSAFSLYAFPCYELVRIDPRRIPRGFKETKKGIVEVPDENWPSRWEQAGGEFYDGRMIARKDSDIWAALGDSGEFGDAMDTDVPPFAFNSGYGWRQVPREECVALGAIGEEDEIEPSASDMNRGLEISKRFDPEFLAALSAGLGRVLARNSADFEAKHPRGAGGRFGERTDIARQIKNGRRALRISLNQKRDMPAAVKRGNYRLDFDYGDPGKMKAASESGYGLSHAENKHPDELRRLPVTLARGSFHQHEEPHKVYVVHKNDVAILSHKERNDGTRSKTRLGVTSHFQDAKTALHAIGRTVLLGGR